MRDLSETLESAQKEMGPALCKLVLTDNGNTYTYGVDTTNTILDLRHPEGQWRQSAEVIVDNRDGNLTALNLIGYKGVISKGFITSEGDEYSAMAPMKVIAQRGNTLEGESVVAFSLAGLMNLLGEDHASADYVPDASNTDTVKTIVDAVLGATLACFSHCTAYTVTWDSEDSLIDTYIPADNFRISYNESRLSVIKRLFAPTKCVIRFEADGNPHVLVPKRTEDAATWVANTAYSTGAIVIPTTPNDYYYICTTAGTSHASVEPTWTTDIGDTFNDGGTLVWTLAYDYEYTRASTDHNFYEKGYRRRLVVPNKVIVESHPDSDDSYTGNATDSTSYSLLPIETHKRLRVASNAQAALVAEALIAKAQAAAEQGHASAPVNVGAEVFDYVNVIDAWSSDYREGNVLYQNTHYTPGKFDFEFRFGSLEMGGFVGTLPPSIKAGDGDLSLSALFDAIRQIYEWLQQIIDILEDHEERIKELEEKTQESKWVTLFDGYTDTPTAAAWAFEAGLPFTPTGQIWFSPIIQEFPNVYVIYVIDEAKEFWKYNITGHHWHKLADPNYEAEDAHRQLVPDDVDYPTALWCASQSVFEVGVTPPGDGIRLSMYDIGGDSWTDSVRTPFYSLLINGENRVGTFSLNEIITGAVSGATAYIKSKVSEGNLWVAPIGTTTFNAGEEIEGTDSGATMDIKSPEGFGSSPYYLYGDDYCSIAAFVYVNSTTIWCWVGESAWSVSAKNHKCILYNPSSGEWTVGLAEYSNQRYGISCAAINSAGTIVYGGASTDVDDYCKYTIATDAYAHTTASENTVFAYAYDKDKLPYAHATTRRQGYIDTSDDSQNDNKFVENELRTATYGLYFGVADDWISILTLAKSSAPELMSVRPGGRDFLGTIYSKGMTWIWVRKPSDDYHILIVDTETNEMVRCDDTVLFLVGEGVWNVYYPTGGDHTGLLVMYKGAT